MMALSSRLDTLESGGCIVATFARHADVEWNGTLMEGAGQAKAVEHVLKRLDLKEGPPLVRIFDFTFTRKVIAELQAKGWKP